MGNFFSSEQIIVDHAKNTNQEELVSKLLVRIRNGKSEISNPFKKLVSAKDMDQRIIILQLWLDYVNNNNDVAIKIRIKNLFENKNVIANEDVQHTDDSGEIVFECPPRFDDPVVKVNDRLLYKPRHPEEILHSYGSIANAMKNIQVKSQDKVALTRDHPVLFFIQREQDKLDLNVGDIQENKEHNVFITTPQVLEKTKNHFMDVYYPDIHETRFENTIIELDPIPEKDINFFLVIKFISLTNK